jgi:hypothetical protein
VGRLFGALPPVEGACEDAGLACGRGALPTGAANRPPARTPRVPGDLNDWLREPARTFVCGDLTAAPADVLFEAVVLDLWGNDTRSTVQKFE